MFTKYIQSSIVLHLTKSCHTDVLIPYFFIFPIYDHSFQKALKLLQNSPIKSKLNIYTNVLVLENCEYLQILLFYFTSFLESTVTFFRIVFSMSASVVLQASHLVTLDNPEVSYFPSRQRLSPELNSKNSPFAQTSYFQLRGNVLSC